MEAVLDLIPPSLILSTLLTLIWGTAWFVWRGGTGRDWLLDVLVAIIGFGAGQLLGWLVDLPLPAVGDVRVVEGSIACLLVLLLLRRGSRR